MPRRDGGVHRGRKERCAKATIASIAAKQRRSERVAAFASTEMESGQAAPKLSSSVIAAKDAESTLPSSSESELDSDDKNSVPVAAAGAAAATLSDDDDYVDESGDNSDGNSVKSVSRRRQ